MHLYKYMLTSIPTRNRTGYRNGETNRQKYPQQVITVAWKSDDQFSFFNDMKPSTTGNVQTMVQRTEVAVTMGWRLLGHRRVRQCDITSLVNGRQCSMSTPSGRVNAKPRREAGATRATVNGNPLHLRRPLASCQSCQKYIEKGNASSSFPDHSKRRKSTDSL